MKKFKKNDEHEPNEQLKEFTLEAYYSSADMSELDLFGGNYINWGYWKGLNIGRSSKISKQTRIKSSYQLYKLVFDSLCINNQDEILEVGCGKGTGCAQLADNYNPKLLVGIDLFFEQINRAKKLWAGYANKTCRLGFKQGNAENMPFENNSFSKLFSLEACQHFKSFDKFLKEAFRVLRPNGVISVASFFGTRDDSHKTLSQYIPVLKYGSDKLRPINKVIDQFVSVGFVDTKRDNIGEHVFEGWDAWMLQNGYGESWDRNWLEAYKRGHIDYCLITARKPQLVVI